MHGGKIPQVLAKAAERVEIETVRRTAGQLLTAWGVQPDADLDLFAVLLGQIQQAAMTCEALRSMVSDESGVFVEVGSDVTGYRFEPTATVKLWNEERDRLNGYVAKAISAGIAERMARLAASQGTQLVQVVERALADPGWALTVQQREQGRSVIARQLREAS